MYIYKDVTCASREMMALPEGSKEGRSETARLSSLTANPWAPCMLNTRNEGKNTGFYSYLARFMNTVILNMNMLLSDTGFTRQNVLSVFLWLRPRNT